MRSNPIERWHDIVRIGDSGGLSDLLADDVVFYSPVMHTPQVGKAITALYLNAAFTVFANNSFRYVREIIGERDAALEFETEIEDTIVNGVDIIRWNDDGRIIEFKVMVRPLKAINLIHQKMGEVLSSEPKI